jgi:hypothetical protein
MMVVVRYVRGQMVLWQVLRQVVVPAQAHADAARQYALSGRRNPTPARPEKESSSSI